MDRRNGRRRRVLRDETRTEENAAVAKRKAGNAVAYSDSALAQPSLTDLIPVRPLRALMTLLGSLTLLVALLVLDDWSAQNGVSSFRLGQPGSLASWFASTLLLWAAVGAVLTFLIRRHRNDDYRGAYHIWIWAAAMLVLASVSATTPWHRHWNDCLTHITGLKLGQHGWWLATLGAVAAGMLIRVAIDARACRTALCLLAAAGGGYVGVALLATQSLTISQYELGELVCHFGLLASHLTLAYAIWWNARYVQLDARGVHAERSAKRLAAKQAREEQRSQKREAKLAAKQQREQGKTTSGGEEEAGESDESPTAKPQRKQRKSSAKSSSAASKTGKTRKSNEDDKAPQRQAEESQDERSDDEERPDTLKLDRSLSKAERRRQRKQQRRAA